MEHCFNHKDNQSVNTCMYCGKQYCPDCLLLHGERKSIICKNCYEVYESKFKKSRIRRIVIITTCFLASGFYTWGIVEDLGDAAYIDSLLNIPIAIILISLGIFNLMRIKQMKNWLLTHTYKFD